MMKKQRGFLHHLILPTLILISVVVSSMGLLYTQNQQGITIARSVDTTREQMTQIRNVLNWCRVMYPASNNGSGLGKNLNLPSSPGNSSWVQFRNIQCPGDTSQSLLMAAHDMLSVPGSFLNEWEYRNTASGVFIRTSVQTAGDPNGQAVLAQVATRLPASQKNLTGDTLEITISN
ncbi:succinyl-diaminopimelate desuccinylase [Novimethylophilus kurashikiensis]|uniref:Succinyl-diaminopimelate desuccinylase n=1 Tax=Novimethylophilus kurashikiensis TaxID=1825523 RepID=A0A2R5F8R7_9PROT|nr:hypothetical protein [Novimethylophilus kurashikiensis]GBG14616.1 succinyl-diaminopimelate desuccinylase [Novimethylophilus kurashikiensis]